MRVGFGFGVLCAQGVEASRRFAAPAGARFIVDPGGIEAVEHEPPQVIEAEAEVTQRLELLFRP